MTRDTRIGAPGGLHLPGILPEPETIEDQDRDWTPQERAVLDDLDQALPAEDHEDPVTLVERGAADSRSEAIAAPRAQVPWWAGTVFFAVAAVACVAAAAMPGSLLLRAIFFVGGVACAALAIGSWRNRTTKSD